MNINYVHTVSPREIQNDDKKYLRWWKSLDHITRSKIYMLMNPYTKKDCKHSFKKEKVPWAIDDKSMYRQRCIICDESKLINEK